MSIYVSNGGKWQELGSVVRDFNLLFRPGGIWCAINMESPNAPHALLSREALAQHVARRVRGLPLRR